MAVIEIRKDASRKELAWFGLLLLAFFGIVGALLRFRFDAPAAARWVWIGATAVTLVYYAGPPIRRYVFLGWMYAAYPIGWVVSHVLLAAVYYLVITPIGLAMRLLGRDPMRRRFEPDRDTYWIARSEGGDVRRYFRQF